MNLQEKHKMVKEEINSIKHLILDIRLKLDLIERKLLIKQKSKFDSEIKDIFVYWVKTFKKDYITLTDNLVGVITRILDKGYSAKDCKKAISGCSFSPFHQGQNSDKAVYDGIIMILNPDKIERFIDIYEANKNNFKPGSIILRAE